jgi:DNA-binding PadR family transcriptional regulator
MTATSTRLLVLGAASIFQPVNGYQLRRELLSWGVADWAHINPGSIYSVLATMARQGFLERHELADGGRAVAVYTVTDEGDTERERLFRECLQTVDLQSPLPFYTAVAVMPLLSREAFAGHLEVRLRSLDEHVEDMTGQGRRSIESGQTPPHVGAALELWIRSAEVERHWTSELLDSVRSGAYSFAGEEPVWQPPPDDPGWQLSKERERYLRLLGRG